MNQWGRATSNFSSGWRPEAYNLARWSKMVGLHVDSRLPITLRLCEWGTLEKCSFGRYFVEVTPWFVCGFLAACRYTNGIAWRVPCKTVIHSRPSAAARSRRKKNSCLRMFTFCACAFWPVRTWRAGLTDPDLAWRDLTHSLYIWFGSLSFSVVFRSHKFLHSCWWMPSQENLHMYVCSIPTCRSEPRDAHFAKPCRPLCRAASRLGHKKWNAKKCDKIFVNDTRIMRRTIAEQWFQANVMLTLGRQQWRRIVLFLHWGMTVAHYFHTCPTNGSTNFFTQCI